MDAANISMGNTHRGSIVGEVNLELDSDAGSITSLPRGVAGGNFGSEVSDILDIQKIKIILSTLEFCRNQKI